MTNSTNTTHDEALANTINLLDKLSKSLGFLWADTERDELATAIQNSKGHMAALREELGDTIAYRAGRKLTYLAEELEGRYSHMYIDEVFAISELREQANASEPRSLDMAYRALHQAWEESAFPEQFECRLKSMVCLTSFGWRVGEILAAHFTEAKAAGSNN